MNPFFRSVKFHLTLFYAFILACILSVFAFFMHAELERVLYRDADERLYYEAIRLEESSRSYLGGFQKLLPPKRPGGPMVAVLSQKQKEKLRSEIQSWEKSTRRLTRSLLNGRVVDFSHEVLLSNLSGWQQEVIFPDFERDSLFMEIGKSFQTIHFEKKPIRLYYHMVRIQGQPVFVIQLGYSLLEVESTLQRLAFIILISIPGVVAVTGVAGWFLAKRSFRPIDSMIREARQITAAYLKRRLPRSQSGDEVDRLAETLNEMMDRLETSTRSIQDFSSDISHELRTPLAIIRGEIDLALRRQRTPEELTETLRVIEGEVNELIRLVDDLMLLVRSDAKQLKFLKKEVSLRKILISVSERFHDSMVKKNIIFHSGLSADAVVKGDELYLKRLFSNLMDNSIKFTPPGGEVRLNLQVEPGLAVVDVSDTGMGIELEMQTKVFSRFYRTDQARSHEGSGLGLNIAKAICDAHDGTIRIQSRPSQGTQVTVILPLTH